MPTQTIQEVQEKYTDQWMAIPGVVGTGIGEDKGRPCIKVFVLQQTQELTKVIPDSVDGYPVVLEATGEFKALEKD